MHGDLRVGGADLDREVAVARGAFEGIPDERRQPIEVGWPLGGDAEAVLAVRLEQRRAETERDGQPARWQVEGLAGVIGRGLRIAAERARGADIEALGHPRGRVRPRAKQPDERGAVDTGQDVERREVEVVLDGRGDAGLVCADERIDGPRR